MGIMREFLDECNQNPFVLRVFLSVSPPLRSAYALRLWMNARGAESLRKTRSMTDMRCTGVNSDRLACEGERHNLGRHRSHD